MAGKLANIAEILTLPQREGRPRNNSPRSGLVQPCAANCSPAAWPDARSKSDCRLVSHDPNWHIKLGRSRIRAALVSTEASRTCPPGMHSNSLGLAACPAGSEGRREEVATCSNGDDSGDHSPKWCYQISEGELTLVRSFGSETKQESRPGLLLPNRGASGIPGREP